MLQQTQINNSKADDPLFICEEFVESLDEI